MESFFSLWQETPSLFEPVFFQTGPLVIYWYALFFLLGSYITYLLFQRQIRKENILDKEGIENFALGAGLAALIGGKIGFLIFYWLPFIDADTTRLFPRTAESFSAWPGMSFFGGVVGVTFFIFWFARRKKISLFLLSDTLALFLPIAIFFGRIGNFFHGELPGRTTESPWGMYFSDGLLRHPSTLYAALLEGALLFYLLFLLRKKKRDASQVLGSGIITAWFCVLYGILRFLSEFFREPDSQIGYIGTFTLNQFFALAFFFFGLVLLSFQKRKYLEKRGLKI